MHNVEAQEMGNSLTASLTQYFAEQGHHGFELRISEPKIHYYSIVWFADLIHHSTLERFACKFVKSDRARTAIHPITDADRAMAADEFESLLRIKAAETHFKTPCRMQAAEPVCFIRELNVIVTKLIDGEDLLRQVRCADLAGRLLRSQSLAAEEHITQVGSYLQKLHEVSSETRTFEGNALARKIQRRADLLAPHTDRELGDALQRSIAAVHSYCPSGAAHIAFTLKGLDLRNILINGGGELFLLDPGKSKQLPREADLGVFSATLDCMHWSAPHFALIAPRSGWAQALLKGYGPADRFLVQAYRLKELLKLWWIAHYSLQLRHKDQLTRRLVARFFINPPHRRLVFRTVAQLLGGE